MSEPIWNLVGDLVALGPLRRDLLPLYQRWVNDFVTTRSLSVTPLPVTEEAELAWYESVAADPVNPGFTVYERDSGRPVGNTALHNVDFRHGTAEWGVLIGEPDMRGKGFGTETGRLMLDYAFTALGLSNVMLTVFENNLAGRRAYEKAGFREFGRRRQARMMGTRRWDVIYMDCLSSEFTGSVLPRVFAGDEPRP